VGRERWKNQSAIDRPGVASPFALRLLSRVFAPFVRVVFRATLEGCENLPVNRPYLLVANHPSSLGVAEFATFLALYMARFGRTRPLAVFAHAVSFRWWPLSLIFSQLGAIPSTYPAAESTLATGVPIALFPGGDHEAFRPFWQQRTVDFGGRLGFLRIAMKAGVPVVPMAFLGVTAPLLLRSRALPYLFLWPSLVGVKRYGLSVLACLGATLILTFVPFAWYWRALLAFAWSASPLAMLPWFPARIRIRIGPPLTAETLFDDASDPSPATDDVKETVLRRALTLVERGVQSRLDGAF
jgi:1-acyl-sn-glycerol-3-phosphate acyltransferase